LNGRRRIRAAPTGNGSLLGLLLLLGTLSTPAIVLSVSPVFYSVLWATCGTSTTGVLGRCSAHWFRSVLGDSSWWMSCGLSCAVAACASTAAVVVVVVAGYFSRSQHFGQARRGYQTATSLLLLVPLPFPPVVYGLALEYGMGRSGIPELAGLIAGNAALLVPIAYFIVEAAQRAVPSARLWAGACLGASPLKNIIHVYVASMRGAVAMAWLVGFLCAFDELIVAMFVWNGPTAPVAKRLWGLFGRASEPTPGVIATLVMLCVAIVYAGGKGWLWRNTKEP
jgi:ABC-type spermidine/putrescine transport system permease subunit II